MNGTKDEEQNDEKSLQLQNKKLEELQANATQGPTLLPFPLASVVTAVTGASSLSIKIGAKVGRFWINAARETTLTSLELTRGTLEALVTAAGRDIALRRQTELGQEDAESMLEWSITALHSALSKASFIASTGFYVSNAALNHFSNLSISGLSTLNAILGSTESSRAVSAIITLLWTEMRKMPEGSYEGEKVGYMDLLIGTTGFVLLQRWGRRKTERDFRNSGGEETIWDTVIDDKGFRADVVGTSRTRAIAAPEVITGRPAMNFCSPTGEDGFEALERGTIYDGPSVTLSVEEQMKLSDEEIYAHIARQLPEGARAVISSESTTVKTIRVQIYDAGTTSIDAPPGTTMVAEHLHLQDGSGESESVATPHQIIVFRTANTGTKSSEMEVHADKLKLITNFDEQVIVADDEDESDEDLVMQESPRKKVKSANSTQPQVKPISPKPFDDKLASAGGSPTQKRSKHQNGTIESVSSPNRESGGKGFQPRPNKERSKSNNKSEKTGTFKKALKSLSPSPSSTAVKDMPHHARKNKSFISNNILFSAIPHMTSTASRDDARNKPLPDPNQQRRGASVGRNGYLSPTSGRTTPSNTFYSVHEKRRESTVSEVDTYSVHSVESRPGSPTFTRTHSLTTNGIKKTQSDTNFGVWTGTGRDEVAEPNDTGRHHHRSQSFAPSLYSMRTKNSNEALLLEVKNAMPRPSIFEDSAILTALIKDGKVPGMFPSDHLVRTVRRFSRFASASYGSNFMRVMGILKSDTAPPYSQLHTGPVEIPHEHTSFSFHTGLPPDAVLLSSWEDKAGVTGNVEWSPSAISTLAHYLSVDHDSKAVVLTCRGTLGFEDVLTDMTCDYDDIYWQGQPYQVHKGIHAAARRMLGEKGRNVMAMIQATLEEYSDYGFILCGHSLGGAMAAVLAILIAEQSPAELRDKSAFITAKPKRLISSGKSDTTYKAPTLTLPPGRPIHVYSYGTPACVSEDLRLATRGLITTVVNHNDFFPSLSIGTLHDFRGVALNLKSDTTGAYENLKSRVWNRVYWRGKNVFNSESARGPPPTEHMAGDGLQEDTWAWAALKTLRAGMRSDKLVPAGEVFVVETNRVFDRQSDSFVATGADTATERVYRSLGRPATRIQFKLIRDVEGRFGELKFGREMFTDHNPGRYEANLAALERGILDI